jgi:hypothetical protein|tara:strand:- start:8350 stop:9033 length:684 start_codon:yes stop_codon:yes gene_type:complete
MTKKRKRKKNNNYFTKVHENAIIEYSASDDLEFRNIIYRDVIRPVFVEMINKIVFTYKFTNLPNVDSLKDECEMHLVTILSNFDPSKGFKAFSYFSVITKNWFIAKVKKTSTQLKREAGYDEISKRVEMDHLAIYNQYAAEREQKEFIEHLWGEIEKWENQNLKENERKVLQAIKILFRESESIEIFNKKAIYLYIREITNLNTKQVLNNLNKFRNEYASFKKKWNE